MPSQASRIARVLGASQDAATALVFADLALGRTFCKLAVTSRDDAQRYRFDLMSARQAHAIAEKYMWRLKQVHPQFDQMMAQSELLKFELERLDKSLPR
jgi:hypothetical protein